MKPLNFPCIVTLFCLACFQVETIWGLTAEELTVSIPNVGIVKGFADRTVASKREFASFQGIPYANVVQRFSPAVPTTQLTRDNSIFDATQSQTACYQPPSPLEDTVFTEDCLTLNVYSPKVNTSKLLPVILFIHGGSFLRWSGNLYNGRRLLERDVVFVSINYRLNVFGFFCLENDDAPGNLGLYDQVLALNWVQKYITNFGGDPNRVIIAGQSAGGASVTYLLDSPLAQNLYQGAISASGDDLSGWTVEETPLPNSLAAAHFLNCTNPNSATQDLKAVLGCMRAVPAPLMVAANAVFYSAPVIQSFALSIPKVTPTNPYTSLVSGLQSRVPLMIGTCKNDASFLVSRLYSGLAPTGLLNSGEFLRNTFLPSLLASSSFGMRDQPIGLFDSLITLYMGSSKNSGNFTQMANGLIDIFSVFYFKAPAYTTAKYHSLVNAATYLYSFDFYGSQTFYPFTGGVPQVPRGVTHVDDLMYLFDYAPFTKIEEEFISRLMVDHWVNFATTGDPNRRNSDVPPLFTLWPKFSLDSQKFLKINTIPTVGSDYSEYWVGASKYIK